MPGEVRGGIDGAARGVPVGGTDQGRGVGLAHRRAEQGAAAHRRGPYRIALGAEVGPAGDDARPLDGGGERDLELHRHVAARRQAGHRGLAGVDVEARERDDLRARGPGRRDEHEQDRHHAVKALEQATAPERTRGNLHRRPGPRVSVSRHPGPRPVEPSSARPRGPSVKSSTSRNLPGGATCDRPVSRNGCWTSDRTALHAYISSRSARPPSGPLLYSRLPPLRSAGSSSGTSMSCSSSTAHGSMPMNRRSGAAGGAASASRAAPRFATRFPALAFVGFSAATAVPLCRRPAQRSTRHHSGAPVRFSLMPLNSVAT